MIQSKKWLKKASEHYNELSHSSMLSIYTKLVEEGDLVLIGGGYHEDLEIYYRNEMGFLNLFTRNFETIVQHLHDCVA